ncbi:TniB family NTP-binding protein [Kitasatospora sp. NBC_00240]|uniref:AAA family ATPase n=1 Tax=Kitasatospora sp. NBC_00240 TaxID=2903567 RepID=UPI00224CB5B0|nr:AAA family ATPase [Kitasatospora sp. NBC_00240]MCX5216235.1 TniB family NTP-binding protein [Kitasatospora sp. NBC_00240]
MTDLTINPLPLFGFGSAPDRTTFEGWQDWRLARGTFSPAPRLTAAEHAALGPRARALNDLHRAATHVNLTLQRTPMSDRVAALMDSRMRNNALDREPGTRDGLMISGGGFQGKTATACDAAAEFEGLWRDLGPQVAPKRPPIAGTRDLLAPVVYCKTPVRATPKGLCQAILDFFGAPHPKTLHLSVRAVRDQLKAHCSTVLILDDITRLRMHREDDQDTLDLVRDLMDMNVTLVLIGVDIPGSGLLREGRHNRRTGRIVMPGNGRRTFLDEAATQTERRFDLIGLDPFDYGTNVGIAAWMSHLAGIEVQLRLLHGHEGMLTGGGMPEYLFARTNGIVGLLKRLIVDGCDHAMRTGAERLTPQLLAEVNIGLGNFPDRDPDAGEIPDIPPATVVPAPVVPGQRRRAKPRNTVFDDHGDRAAGE